MKKPKSRWRIERKTLWLDGKSVGSIDRIVDEPFAGKPRSYWKPSCVFGPTVYLAKTETAARRAVERAVKEQK